MKLVTKTGGIIPFNQTNVELKFVLINKNMKHVCAFNQTNVELKLTDCIQEQLFQMTFNQTNVELKSQNPFLFYL